jgi:hypothetical protein
VVDRSSDRAMPAGWRSWLRSCSPRLLSELGTPHV